MTIQANQGFGVSIFGATTSGGGGSTSPGGSSGQLQYNASGSFGGMAGTSWDDTNRALTLTGATVTTSQPVLNLSQTWNDGVGGTVIFTGLRFNATDTASNAASRLFDLQIGGTSVFSVIKNGGVRAVNYNVNNGADGFWSSTRLALNRANNAVVSWSATNAASTGDAFISSPAAATLQLGAADAAAPVAQTLQVQSVVAGTSNTAGANFTINGSKGTGTGAGGSIIFQTAAAGITGTAQNAYAVALTIDGTGAATFSQGSLVVQAGTNTNIIQLGAGYAVSVANNGLFRWSSTSLASGTADLILARDAANTLALRNGTTAQRLNIYGTYTDAANYERVGLYYSAGDAYYLAFDKAGTGSNRNLKITSGGDLYFQITGGSYYWYFTNAGGHLFAGADNTYDIGASSANRPRNVYVGSAVISGGFQAVSGATYTYVYPTYVSTTGDYLFYNNTGSMKFGTSADVILSRSAAGVLKVAGASSAGGAVQYNAYTYANLPTGAAGMVAYISDASNAAPAWGDTVTAGGGTTKVLCWYNGTNWTVIGK